MRRVGVGADKSDKKNSAEAKLRKEIKELRAENEQLRTELEQLKAEPQK